MTNVMPAVLLKSPSTLLPNSMESTSMLPFNVSKKRFLVLSSICVSDTFIDQ